MIKLSFCEFERFNWGCTTRFRDGSHVDAFPHWENHHYHVIAHRCGYADDLLTYCQEHEFAHNFIAEKFSRGISPILAALAIGSECSAEEAAYEEALVHIFQAWLRANQEPIIGGIDWRGLKAEALELLECPTA